MTALLFVRVPMAVPSASNLREHWRSRARRVKAQRFVTTAHLRAMKPPPLPLTVVLTRAAPRRLDDDNLRGALKAVRDAVAAWLGVDDGSSAVRWEYGQEKTPAPRKGQKVLPFVRIDVHPWKGVPPTG